MGVFPLEKFLDDGHLTCDGISEPEAVECK